MKRSRTTKVIAEFSTVVWILGGSAVTCAAQTNLIVNGSFETGPAGVQHFPGWDLIGPASNNSNYGVVQSSASPKVAEAGSFYAYFHGHPTDSSQDCLGQTLANLTVGAQYTISYYLATDGSTLGSGAGMWVQFGADFGLSSGDALLTAFLPNSASALPYQKFTTTVTATQASEILSFHAFDSASSILLDNVSVTLVVPPAPQLNLRLSPTNTLVFTWTSATTGFRLQGNASLVTTNWVTLTNVPVALGSSNQIVLPAPTSRQFYRLALP